MQDEPLAVVRDRYLESTRKDKGTGNSAKVSACLSWAVQWEYLEGNPALKQRSKDELPEASAGTTPARSSGVPKSAAFRRFVDRRAEEAVDERGLEAVPELRNRALVYLLVCSGARSAEVLRGPNDARRDGHRWGDVDLEEGVLTVRGKSQDEQRVQLPEQPAPHWPGVRRRSARPVTAGP